MGGNHTDVYITQEYIYKRKSIRRKSVHVKQNEPRSVSIMECNAKRKIKRE